MKKLIFGSLGLLLFTVLAMPVYAENTMKIVTYGQAPFRLSDWDEHLERVKKNHLDMVERLSKTVFRNCAKLNIPMNFNFSGGDGFEISSQVTCLNRAQ